MTKHLLTTYLLVFGAMLFGWLNLDVGRSQAQTPDTLHTQGSQIVDAQGNPVILTGINWFGLETDSYAPHGLWARNLESILDQIVDLGFNTIRLPYSNQLLDSTSMPNGINYDLNPELKGMNGLEIMDKLIQEAGKRGLKVVLDRHRPDSHAQSELWYTGQYSEERWIQDWVMLAKRYAGDDTVIGVDLHNEPHGQATWGSGDPSTDWRLAAEKAGNAILAANPNLLIIVQGVDHYQDDWYWWGGNLMGAKDYPVQLDLPGHLVYSTHVYGPGVYPQPWFWDSKFPDNLPGIWDQHWGYLSREGIAPVVVGEFGGRSVGNDKEGIWQRSLVSYMRQNNFSYFYWTLNPNSGDTGGLLLDDWKTVDPKKEALLSGYQFSIIGIEQQSSKPAVELTPPAPPITGTLRLRYKTEGASSQSTDSKPDFVILNTGTTPVPLNQVELRYWLKEDPGQSYVFHCDWAKIGCANLMGDFQAPGNGISYLSLQFSPSAGSLQPGEDSGEIKARFNLSDWSTYNQDEFYSFAPLSDYTDWDHVTLYLDGNLVWGAEPGGNPAPAAQLQATKPKPTTPPEAITATETFVPSDTLAPIETPQPTPGTEGMAAANPTARPTPTALPASQDSNNRQMLFLGAIIGSGLSLLVFILARALKRVGSGG